MNFKDNVPIYLQIKDLIITKIATGKLEPGNKLPSVRELALELSVNTNTVQRALSNLTDGGIVKTERGRGNYVTDDPELVTQLKIDLVNKQLDEMYQNLRQLNLTNEEIVVYLKYYLEEHENEK